MQRLVDQLVEVMDQMLAVVAPLGVDQIAALVIAEGTQSLLGRDVELDVLGPQLLVEAGVPLVDDVGPDVFTKISEGTLVRLQGDTVYVGEEVVAKGRVQTAGTVAEAMTEAKDGIAAQLQDFVTNTLEYVKGEGGLLVDGIAAPELRTRIEGRHVLVVVRGNRFREDLAVLRPGGSPMRCVASPARPVWQDGLR